MMATPNCTPLLYACPECVRVVVGPAVHVGGPNCCDYDSPFASGVSDGRWLGYSANSRSYLVANGSRGFADNASFLSDPLFVGLEGSHNASRLDQCGEWLNAVIVDPEDAAIVHGYYHEEWQCNYSRHGYTNKSIGYARSTDGGRSFAKLGVDSSIITPPLGNTTTEHQTGEGDHGVARFGDELLLYFRQWDPVDHPQVRVGAAASSLAARGVPGAWRKFWRGGYTEPGRGGASDALANITGTAVYSTSGEGAALGWGACPMLVSVGSSSAPYYGSPRLAFSPNGTAWRAMTPPLLHADGAHPAAHTGVEPHRRMDRRNASGIVPSPAQAVTGRATPARPSCSRTSPSPATPTAQRPSPWTARRRCFYTYLQPGETFHTRYLAARRIWVSVEQAPITPGAMQATVALSQCRRGGAGGPAEYWATTAMVPTELGYACAPPLGALLTSTEGMGAAAVRPLHDCAYTLGSGALEHMVGFEHECPRPHGPAFDDAPERQATRAESVPTPPRRAGVARFLRTLGWAWVANGSGRVSLTRCFNEASQRHAVTLSASCEASGLGRTEFVLGYLMRWDH